MKNYKDFKAIKTSYTREQKATDKSNICYMLENWERVRTHYISEYLTKREQNKVKTESETKAAIIKKWHQRTEKKIKKFCEYADQIAQTPKATIIIISVDWVRSRTWGMNPHAEIRADGTLSKGSASGCGYDKRSSAIAQALNENKAILNILYNLWEEALRKGLKVRDFVGCGSGYSRPYFEGGVGYECFRAIFQKAGAKINIWNEGKNWDYMQIEL